MNICERCEMRFDSVIYFNEHKLLDCLNIYLESYSSPIELESSMESAQRIVSSGRMDLERHEYSPMAKDVKAMAVSKGQEKLGAQHFFGGNL